MAMSTFENGDNNHAMALRPDIEGQKGAAQFRYSRDGFRRSLIIAMCLTALICGLVWLLLGIYGSPNMNLYTAIAGLLFFAFISARMLAQYFRDDVVLAVQPTGLFDARISMETIPWEAVKELVLSRREQEYSLSVHLWPHSDKPNLAVDHSVELSSLEGGSEAILAAIQLYMPIKMER